MKKQKYYRFDHSGALNSRNWTLPPFGWHKTRVAAARDAISWTKFQIKYETQKLKTLEAFLKREAKK